MAPEAILNLDRFSIHAFGRISKGCARCRRGSKPFDDPNSETTASKSRLSIDVPFPGCNTGDVERKQTWQMLRLNSKDRGFSAAADVERHSWGIQNDGNSFFSNGGSKTIV